MSVDSDFENVDLDDVLDINLEDLAEPGQLSEGTYIGQVIKLREGAGKTGTKFVNFSLKATEVVDSTEDSDSLNSRYPVRHTVFFKNKAELNKNLVSFVATKLGISFQESGATNLREYLDYVEAQQPVVKFSFTRTKNEAGYDNENVRVFRYNG